MIGFRDIGILKPGYAADFVVLEEDIFSQPEEKLADVKVRETYINGERVFCAE